MTAAALDGNFFLRDSQAKLATVQSLLHGLPPSGVRALSRLRDAAQVMVFLRRRGTVEERDFHDAVTRATGRAATDEHALDVLNQLVRVRDVVKGFLRQPAALQDVCRTVAQAIKTQQREAGLAADAPLDAEPGGDALSELIDNVVRNWDFVSLFFADGSSDAAQAADTLAKVRTFMESGRYLVRFDAQMDGGRAAAAGERKGFEIYLRYTSNAAAGGGRVVAAAAAPATPHLLRPDALLDAVRLAVLSQAATSEPARRAALGDFKRSYDIAIRLAQEYAELLAAGHPDFQPAAPAGAAADLDADDPYRLTSIADAGCSVVHLEARLLELQRTRNAWQLRRDALLEEEPRLRLLGSRGRLHAILAVRAWREGRGTPAAFADVLLPYVLQAVPEMVKRRSAAAQPLAAFAATAAAPTSAAAGMPDARDDDLRVVLQAVQALCSTAGIHWGPRSGSVDEAVVVVDATDSRAALAARTATSAAAASFARAYDAQLESMNSAASTGVAPAQVLWCARSTTVDELAEWLDIVMVPGLVTAASAIGVQALMPALRQRLARAFVEQHYRAGCAVTLIFAGSSGMDAFSSFPRAQPPRDPVMAPSKRINALLATQSIGSVRIPASPAESSRVIDSVTVVAGAARSGKSRWIVSEVARAGANAVHLRIPVHEGFSGAAVIARYELAAATAAAAGAALCFHFDVYDAAADLHALAAFFHVLLSTGILRDGSSGRARLLRAGQPVRVFVELPALCPLDAKMDGGPRFPWPESEVDDGCVVPSRHPFMQLLAPLTGSAVKSVTPASFPLVIDADAALVAHYIAFAAQAATAAVPAVFPTAVVAPTTPEAVAIAQATIDAAMQRQRPPLPRQNGARAAFIRALAGILPQVSRMRAEVARQAAAGQYHRIRQWAEAGPRRFAGRGAAPTTVPDFYREMVRILMACAAQLVRPSTSSDVGATEAVSLWPVFHPTLANGTLFLLCGCDTACGAGLAALPDSDIGTAVALLRRHDLPLTVVAGHALGPIRSELALAFGFSAATDRMFEMMQDGEWEHAFLLLLLLFTARRELAQLLSYPALQRALC